MLNAYLIAAGTTQAMAVAQKFLSRAPSVCRIESSAFYRGRDGGTWRGEAADSGALCAFVGRKLRASPSSASAARTHGAGLFERCDSQSKIGLSIVRLTGPN